MVAVVKKDSKGTSLELVSTEIPKPIPGFVLVKVHATSIIPTDMIFIRGGFDDLSSSPKLPMTLGVEGSGTVIDIGEGVDTSLKGKHALIYIKECELPAELVCSGFVGTWAGYTLVSAKQAVVIPEGVSLEVGATVQANAPTVMEMWDIIKTGSYKAIA
jgi:NADPH:quinone reductase-like Zn-dependent oxidoreductase